MTGINTVHVASLVNSEGQEGHIGAHLLHLVVTAAQKERHQRDKRDITCPRLPCAGSRNDSRPEGMFITGINTVETSCS